MSDMNDRLPISAGQTEFPHLLRRWEDEPQEMTSVSAETLAMVLPLTALLDVLHRRQDQHVELGRRLAEALGQIAATVQATARDVEILITQDQDIKDQLTVFIAAPARLEAGEDEILNQLGTLEQQNAQLAADLFEDPDVPLQT